jgi:FtsH-binding integral membrane protein
MSTKPMPPTSAAKSRRLATTEEAFMRKVMMFFVIGLCIFSEVASLVIFFRTSNAGSLQMAIVLQFLPLLCVYKILSYLFPGPDVQSNPLIVLAKLLLKHP